MLLLITASIDDITVFIFWLLVVLLYLNIGNESVNVNPGLSFSAHSACSVLISLHTLTFTKNELTL